MKKSIPIITSKQLSKFLPRRPRISHKGMFGTVAVLGGANGMIGAPLLAARAALRLGAGCIHVGLMSENAPMLDILNPELMLHPISDALKLRNIDVYAAGCGLGTSTASQRILCEVLTRDSKLVLDADALNLIASHSDLQIDLYNRTSSILTPHPGEAARLLACSINDIQSDRVSSVVRLSKKYNCSVVLKGADSLCATRDGKIYLNKTGNSGMSSPGMGDVLTGIIAAFIAQGLGENEAMLLGVYLHGAAGDALAECKASIGMTASEVIEWARWILNKLE